MEAIHEPLSGRRTTEQMVTSCLHPSAGLIDHIDHGFWCFFAGKKLNNVQFGEKKYGYFLQYDWTHAA